MEPIVPVLKALADGTRVRLARVLRGGAFNVNELVGILEMGQSRVSHHLRVLLDAGLVEARREGTWVYYRLSERWSSRDRAGARGGGGWRFLRLLGHELEASDDPTARRDRRAVTRCLDGRRRQAAVFFEGMARRWDIERDSVQGPPDHLARLVALFDAGDTCVDLGTGTGILLPALSARARRVIGVDASNRMLDVARERAARDALENVELRLGTLEHLPVPDGTADVLVANMVLHHVAHPPEAIAEAHRALQAGGRFVLAELAAHREETYRERLGDLWLGFERDDLGRWLEEARFELEQVEELPGREGHPATILMAARRGAGSAPEPGVPSTSTTATPERTQTTKAPVGPA